MHQAIFLLITYCIIEKLYDNLSGVNTKECKIVALFFADDGMILMQSLRETKESIQVLINIAEECRMNINKTKSYIMIYNHKEKIRKENIEGIQITDTINYLGDIIQNKSECFKKHTIEQMNKARRYADLMPAVIAKSCNKLLIGKTYWKSATLPAILHGSEVVCYTENQITKLQTEKTKH